MQSLKQAINLDHAGFWCPALGPPFNEFTRRLRVTGPQGPSMFTPYLPSKAVPTTRTLKSFISLFQAFAVIPPSAFVAARRTLDIAVHMKRDCLAFRAFYLRARLPVSDGLLRCLKIRFAYYQTTVRARQADTGSHRPMVGFSIPHFTAMRTATPLFHPSRHDSQSSAGFHEGLHGSRARAAAGCNADSETSFRAYHRH